MSMSLSLCCILFSVPLLMVLCVNAERVHPIILVPGYGGSQIECRLNKTKTDAKENSDCPQESDWFTLWLELSQLFLHSMDCWVQNVRMIYNKQTRRSVNNPGVETWIPGFGNTSTVEYLTSSDSWASISSFADIVYYALNQGYVRGSNIHGAPYDFRKAANEQEEYFGNVKNLIEETFKANGETPVIIVTHSMGSNMMLYFLTSQSSSWKMKYVRCLISLSAPWGGSVDSVKAFAIGDNLGIPVLNEKKMMMAMRTSTSLVWLMPQEGFWDPEEVLVETKDKNYTVSDYEQFFLDMDEPNSWLMREDTKDLLYGLPAPGVEVFCLHGVGLDTTERLVYGDGDFPGDGDVIYGDGDSTVNTRSLRGCTRWSEMQLQPVHHREFRGVDHLSILSYPMAETIGDLIANINLELNKKEKQDINKVSPIVELLRKK